MRIKQEGKWVRASGIMPFFIVILFFSQFAYSEEFPEFQGYYLKNGNEYVSFEPYSHVRFGFDKLKDIVSVEREDESLYVHVYRENWDPVRSYFYTKPIAIINHDLYDEQSPKIKSLGDDHYLLKFKDIGSNNVLFVKDYTGDYAIVLGNAQEELVKLFENTEESPTAVLPNLEEALESYPDNDDLKDMLPKWKKERQNQLDERQWQIVKDQWARYENAKSVEDKLRHLKRAKAYAENYLNSFSGAKHQNEAESYIETADQKLSL